MAENGRKIFVMGHPEYDRVTLDGEYKRDLAEKICRSIFRRTIIRTTIRKTGRCLPWRSHANNLYTNWLNYYVYQITPYDLNGYSRFFT